jgi:hypothetical protein
MPSSRVRELELYTVQIDLLDASHDDLVVARGTKTFSSHSRKHVKIELLPNRGISQSRTTVHVLSSI